MNYRRDGNNQTYENEYDDDGKLSRIVLPNGSSESIEYDVLGRVTGIQHPVHKDKIEYYQNGDNATNIPVRVRSGRDSKKYTYDENGNIKEIFENGKLSVKYEYDGLDRLVREDNVRLNRTYTFDHDTNGNILYKNEYPFSTAADLTRLSRPIDHRRNIHDNSVVSVTSLAGRESCYLYAEDGNRDRLTEFNGETCEYDALDNPRVYRNKALEWDHLKDLVQYGGTKFTYDASGLRQSKSHAGPSFPASGTKFFWAGSKLLGETRTIEFEEQELNSYPMAPNAGLPNGDHIHSYLYAPQTGIVAYFASKNIDISYLHGANGVVGLIISRNGNSDVRTYYYRRNIQGDITHILDHEGNVEAEYVYDAWGNHKVLGADGTVNESGNFIGNINPFRYRGYYFDSETNLYYLRSRYYDPETGRFISPDEISIFDTTKENINGLNLYMYCACNPVMNVDPSGQDFWNSVLFGIAGNWFCENVMKPASKIGIDIMIAAKKFTDENWELIVGAIVILGLGLAVVLSGGTALAPIAWMLFEGAAVGAFTGLLVGGVFGGVEGAKSGFMWGAIGGALSGYFGIGGNMLLSGGLTAIQGLLDDNFSWTDIGISAVFGAMGGAVGLKLSGVKGAIVGGGLSFAEGFTTRFANGPISKFVYPGTKAIAYCTVKRYAALMAFMTRFLRSTPT